MKIELLTYLKGSVNGRSMTWPKGKIFEGTKKDLPEEIRAALGNPKIIKNLEEISVAPSAGTEVPIFKSLDDIVKAKEDELIAYLTNAGIDIKGLKSNELSKKTIEVFNGSKRTNSGSRTGN